MIKRILLSVFCISVFSSVFATGVEPLDYILVSRKITPELEATFDGKDNSKYSNFWSAWITKKNLYDHVNMVPSRNGWKRSTSPFTSPDDATMNVYAAWGSKGIYLLYEVIDDQSCDNCITCLVDTAGKQYCPPDPSWMNDAIDVYIDKYSTITQLQLKDNVFIDYTRDRQTKTMVQIQFRFGAQDNVTNFRFNKYDQATKVMTYNNYDFTYAANNLDGLIFKTVKTDNPNRKFQEWFIPWSQVGNDGGLPIGARMIGNKFALVLGYNDADAGADSYDALRWKNQADPTKRVPPDSASVCQPVGPGQWTCNWKHVPTESWCDFELGPNMDQADIGVKLRKVSQVNPSNIKTLEYFTIAGSKIKTENGRVRSSKGALILERTVLTNGNFQTSIKALK